MQLCCAWISIDMLLLVCSHFHVTLYNSHCILKVNSYVTLLTLNVSESQSWTREDRNASKRDFGKDGCSEPRRYCRWRFVRSGNSSSCSGTSDVQYSNCNKSCGCNIKNSNMAATSFSLPNWYRLSENIRCHQLQERAPAVVLFSLLSSAIIVTLNATTVYSAQFSTSWRITACRLIGANQRLQLV